MDILLIEDDIQLNTTVKKFLESLKHNVSKAYDGIEAIETIEKGDFDLYIIDINLPNINGLDIVRYIRQVDLSVPIVVITAATELHNFENAFINGCNEFIKKPFYLEELKIRIDNLLNCHIDETIFISNNTSFNMKKEELSIENNVIHLRKKEKRLLKLLLKNKNFTVKTETIENYVWENEIKDYYPIRQLINDLRNKFNTGEQFILTDPKIGYKFEIKE